jgi:hypothetical protein
VPSTDDAPYCNCTLSIKLRIRRHESAKYADTFAQRCLYILLSNVQHREFQYMVTPKMEETCSFQTDLFYIVTSSISHWLFNLVWINGTYNKWMNEWMNEPLWPQKLGKLWGCPQSWVSHCIYIPDMLSASKTPSHTNQLLLTLLMFHSHAFF